MSISSPTVVPFGHSPLTGLAIQIREGHARAGRYSRAEDWIEGTLQVATALLQARTAMPSDIDFSEWLQGQGLTFYNKNDRAALISFAADLALAREVLTASSTRCYQNIWRRVKHGFPTEKAPPGISRRKVRNQTRATLHRRMKLGDDVIDKLKRTSLDSAAELDELVMLNRGAPEGELTPIVRQLVDDAVAGKDVSAIALHRSPKKPNLVEAWRKRMVWAWEQATKDEQNKLIEYLWDHMKT